MTYRDIIKELVKTDQVIRSGRKTMALVVTADGRLVVRAPLTATQSQIDEVISQHTDWIKKQQVIARSKTELKPSRRFIEGERFPYLGNEYSLHLVELQLEPVVLDRNFSLAQTAQWNALAIFRGWYARQAKEILPRRVATFSRQHGFIYNQIRVKDIRTRWGSCSSRGNLNFNFRLVMAPMEVIDYVVVHELVHLKIKNHSGQFWQAVEAILPDDRSHRLWLKKYGKGFYFL